ncbi:unnamed protein product [Ectocarpus sp. CCAP 1310/34]|nr:unnamed protein product [Ectocarpus sp. CCAP 1310/34]
MPLEALKAARELVFFPAAGAPASTVESLAQSGQIKTDATATGMHGRVVGLGRATGASSEDGVCGQAVAEHCKERKEGSEAKGLSEEDVGDGFDAGPGEELSRAVTEQDVEGDGDSTVGLKREKGADPDSVAPRQAGKLLKTEQGKSSRSQTRESQSGVSYLETIQVQFLQRKVIQPVFELVVIQQLHVSTKDLQCSSLTLSEACRRAPTLVVVVGRGYLPLERLAGCKKNHEAGVPPATAGNMMTGPGLIPESKRLPRILPRGLVC